jgi:hypothetical protein
MLKIAAVAVSLLFAAALPARAADVTADDTARFLAGMQPSAESPLMPLTKDPAWQHHARFFDAAFAQLEQHQLSRIHAWADANLAAPRPTMFYMFSGPDFLYANAFFPRQPDQRHAPDPLCVHGALRQDAEERGGGGARRHGHAAHRR